MYAWLLMGAGFDGTELCKLPTLCGAASEVVVIGSDQPIEHTSQEADAQLDRPLFSLSLKKMIMRHSFFTITSASSSSAYRFSQ